MQSNNYSRATATGSGETVRVTFDWTYSSSSELVCWIRNNTTLEVKSVAEGDISAVYGSQYVDLENYWPETSITAYVARNTPRSSTYNPRNGVAIDPSALMAAIDKLTRIAQELYGQEPYTPITSIDSFTIPDKAARALKILGFDAAGDPLYQTTKERLEDLFAILETADPLDTTEKIIIFDGEEIKYTTIAFLEASLGSLQVVPALLAAGEVLTPENDDYVNLIRDNTLQKITVANLLAAILPGLNLDNIADTASYVRMTPAERTKLLGLENACIYKGDITLAADFPDPLLVEPGWTYDIQGTVTDNDPTKTNTGQSFVAGDEVRWNSVSWTLLGPEASDQMRKSQYDTDLNGRVDKADQSLTLKDADGNNSSTATEVRTHLDAAFWDYESAWVAISDADASVEFTHSQNTTDILTMIQFKDAGGTPITFQSGFVDSDTSAAGSDVSGFVVQTPTADKVKLNRAVNSLYNGTNNLHHWLPGPYSGSRVAYSTFDPLTGPPTHVKIFVKATTTP